MELIVHLDNGEVGLFNAFRVQHNNSRGPYKGGLRFHPQVDLDDVRRWDILFMYHHKAVAVPCSVTTSLSIFIRQNPLSWLLKQQSFICENNK